MANLFNYYPKKTYLRVNYDEYWDFYLSLNNSSSYSHITNGVALSDKCLISNIDSTCFNPNDDKWLQSKSDNIWNNATSIKHTLYNIGFTGLDNGLVNFRRDQIDNRKFVDLYTNTKFDINEDDLSLKLHRVSGGTLLYDYPVQVLDDKIKFNGGFYQGFFKTECDKYMILPDKLESGEEWNFQFTINKTEFEKESNKTLNDKYPDNKGIFFYIGTRAENKWVYLYNKKDDDCFTLSYDDYIEDAHIDKSSHKINSFIDMSVEMPVEWESIAIDDYLNFKHYDDKLYSFDHDVSADFLNDFVDLGDITPKVIDEENNQFTTIEWCCGIRNNNNVTPSHTYVKHRCCSCPNILVENDLTTSSTKKGYFSKCEVFGDDYLSDIEDMDFGVDYIENDLDISNFIFETYDGINLSINGQYYIDTDNKFLLFDRTCNGFTIKNWEENTLVRYYGTKNNFKGNLFLLMNRTSTGYNINTIEEYQEEHTVEYNAYSDLYNNALAFRITDDGRIGYRYLTFNCENENQIEIKESYSQANIIKENEWYSINVKIKASETTMKLYFYINGYLKFVSDNLPKINLRELNEVYDKQETVPFNISLGGGTQGLAETILPNYMLDPYKVYPLEKYFGGSFIGYISSFRFYNCKLEQLDILNNSKYDLLKN